MSVILVVCEQEFGGIPPDAWSRASRPVTKEKKILESEGKELL